MMHQFLELNDGTQIVHSDVMYDEKGKEFVEVYMEKPVKLGFKSAYCYLPAYKWDKVDGFDEEEMRQLEEMRDLMAVIEARSGEVVKKWYKFHKEISYYC